MRNRDSWDDLWDMATEEAGVRIEVTDDPCKVILHYEDGSQARLEWSRAAEEWVFSLD